MTDLLDEPDRLPIIGVTGALGAGKTTVVNHLLRRAGARLGVVVNDFGAINVDAALVTGQIDEVAAISGGCLCCLPDAGGLDDALARLAHPRLRLDAVIVEASGVADPVALARLIRFSGVDRARPGGLIEVVDAVNLHAEDAMVNETSRYRASTLVVVTKTDLLGGDERDAVVRGIRDRVLSASPHAELVVAPHGAVDPQLVFDVATEEDPADELPLARLVRDERAAPHRHAHSVSVRAGGPVCPSALVDLLESPPAGTYRLKGRVAVRGANGLRGYVVNVVGDLIHVVRLPAPPSPSGELVAIGRRLDESAARSRLERVLSAPATRAEAAGLRRLQRYGRLSR